MERGRPRCNRCDGAMSFESFTDRDEGSDDWCYEGWRCVHCGEIVDPLILFNRGNPERGRRPFPFRNKIVLIRRTAHSDSMAPGYCRK